MEASIAMADGVDPTAQEDEAEDRNITVCGVFQHLFETRLFENICQEDEELYDWLLNWMALAVQRPGSVIGTAPIFSGVVGVGKGFVAHQFGRLWGKHYISVTDGLREKTSVEGARHHIVENGPLRLAASGRMRGSALYPWLLHNR